MTSFAVKMSEESCSHLSHKMKFPPVNRAIISALCLAIMELFLGVKLCLHTCNRRAATPDATKANPKACNLHARPRGMGAGWGAGTAAAVNTAAAAACLGKSGDWQQQQKGRQRRPLDWGGGDTLAEPAANTSTMMPRAEKLKDLKS